MNCSSLPQVLAVDKSDSESVKSTTCAKDESRPYTCLEQGPHTFYLWADAVYALFDEYVDEQPVLRCKTAITEIYESVRHLPEDERENAEVDALRGIRQWEVDVTDGARSRPSAQVLGRKWRRRAGAEGPAGSREGSPAGDNSSDEEADDWWWEVTLQREMPPAEWPTLEVGLHQIDNGKDCGTWWITNIRPAGEEGDHAMSMFIDHLIQELM